MDEPQNAPPPLKTKLNLWDTASLIVGIIVGVGIFIFPARVFTNTPDIGVALLLWALGGVLSLVGAFCFAELASTYPRSGGEYVYLSRAYGSWAGFLFAWAQLAVNRPGATIGVLAFAFAVYAGKLFDIDPDERWVFIGLAGGVIAVLTFVNILGVGIGKRTQNLLTLVKVVAVLGILVAGFCFGRAGEQVVQHGTIVEVRSGRLVLQTAGPEPFVYQLPPAVSIRIDAQSEGENDVPFSSSDLKPGMRAIVWAVKSSPDVARGVRATRAEYAGDWVAMARLAFPGLALSMIGVLWTYSGWHEGAYVAAEIHDERRTLPLALMLGTGLVSVIYLLMNLAYWAGLGFEQAGQSSTIAADVLGLVFGAYAGRLMALLVMISCLGALHGAIFTSSRIYTAVGEDHPLFAPLRYWNPRLGSPVTSLVVQGVMSVAFVVGLGLLFPGDDPFDALLNCTAAVFWLFFFLTGLSLFVLRRKDPHRERPFRTPGYPVTPIIFCAASLGMVYASWDNQKSMIGVGLLAAGIPFYLLSLFLQNRNNTKAAARPVEGEPV